MPNIFPFIRPFIHALEAEKAHNVTISALKAGFGSLFGSSGNHPSLATEVMGLRFSNPVGIAAGFDKNAEVIDPVLNLGFGFAEAGTVTPEPQDGNPKPRLFRLPEDRAVINRFGFNNEGLVYFKNQLKKVKTNAPFGANVGANKTSEDKTADYVKGVEELYGLSAYFTVNISSPNTPGLRALQSREALTELVERVLEAREAKTQSGMKRIPIVVKIAPDLLEEDITDIAHIALNTDIDGLIVSNTTIERPESLQNPHKGEAGGLSGAPLMDKATDVLSAMYKATSGTVPLIGVGGIANGADAYRKIRAGASLVQLYSALVYEGPGLVTRIKNEMAVLLEKDGFTSIGEAVGADHR